MGFSSSDVKNKDIVDAWLLSQDPDVTSILSQYIAEYFFQGKVYQCYSITFFLTYHLTYRRNRDIQGGTDRELRGNWELCVNSACNCEKTNFHLPWESFSCSFQKKYIEVDLHMCWKEQHNSYCWSETALGMCCKVKRSLKYTVGEKLPLEHIAGVKLPSGRTARA